MRLHLAGSWSPGLFLRARFWDSSTPYVTNDLAAGVESTLRNFADDTKLGGAVESLEGQEAFQRDIYRTRLSSQKHWAVTNAKKFNKSI